ncbi:MAG: FAD-linked oxidase C-terminal domain-containing protein [Bacillota bacterium]|nr:FAD-linked oxidase C-terminal domain-containing protein [Bacillota bacterium]
MSIINSLVSIVGKDNILTKSFDREIYSYDSSPYSAVPLAVVFPKTTEETAQVVQACAEAGVAVTPRGAGTCLSGGAITSENGILISMTKMDKILNIDLEQELALVEPGVVNYSLQEALEPHGYFFAPDPSSFRVATLGGNTGENAGGIKGVKYGVTKNHILGLEVVLPDGEVINTGKLAPQKGIDLKIDLTNLFCGSEGTLGIVTKILVNITKKPEAVKTMLVTFNQLEEAGNLVANILKAGIIPTTLEIMDKTVTRAVEDYLQLGLPKDVEAMLLVEVDGTPDEVESRSAKIIELFKRFEVNSFQVAKDDNERNNLWKARRSANGALGKLKSAYMVQDVVVPINKLTKMLTAVTEIGKKYNIIIGQVAHAGDGNLHPHLLYDHDNHEEKERAEEASAEIFRETINLEGTLSGEHGIGMEKLPYMGWAFNEQELEFKRSLKESLDPTWQFNRGKLISAKKEG